MPLSSPDSTLEDGIADAEQGLTDKQWASMFRDALRASSSFYENKLRGAWSRNYRAFNNRHMAGSKYDSTRYKHRSKLFKPKTRMAVRKNDSTAASAMFSTEDVVSITPERASDRKQAVTARFIHGALNYRLDKGGPFTGPNWFLTAIGARQDAQLTGICVSKQYWQFEERLVPVFVTVPKIDPVSGLPVIGDDGQPVLEEDIEHQSETVIDRLYIDLLPGEHAFIDPAADWRDPIQTGGYFFAAYPVRKEDLEDMIDAQAARPKMGGGAWRTDIDLTRVLAAKGSERRQSQSVRRAREDGADRYESRFTDQNGDVIWLYECFYRYNATDWHFWMLGETILLSDPRPVEESYPAGKGQRPYVRGLGNLEAHRVHPTAPVELWQPLQQEMNDLTNLKLDATKMGISPITKIRRGRNIDFKQVQNRGPDAMVMVEEADDVTFDRAPTPPNTQLDINNLNVDFDELAGIFSQGSVQTNRTLNETVGGMNLLAASSNALTEFDLRVWVETWAEPVLRQCVDLIKYYETSETVIAVAGEKAGLIALALPSQKQDALEADEDDQEPMISVSEVLNNLDHAAVSVRVNVGIGAMDSRQKLEKFMGGVKVTMEMAPLLAADDIMPDGKELVQEAWGLLGYRDASRFYKRKPQPSGPPPEVQAEMMKQQGRMAEKKADGDLKMAIENIRAGLDRMAQQIDASQGQQKIDLERDRFEHQRRMDEFDARMSTLQQRMDAMQPAAGQQRLPGR